MIEQNKIVMKFRCVSNEVIEHVKIAAKNSNEISIKTVPALKSRSYSHLFITINSYSWLASRNCYKEFLTLLSVENCRILLALQY